MGSKHRPQGLLLVFPTSGLLWKTPLRTWMNSFPWGRGWTGWDRCLPAGWESLLGQLPWGVMRRCPAQQVCLWSASVIRKGIPSCCKWSVIARQVNEHPGALGFHQTCESLAVGSIVGCKGTFHSFQGVKFTVMWLIPRWKLHLPNVLRLCLERSEEILNGLISEFNGSSLCSPPCPEALSEHEINMVNVLLNNSQWASTK